MIYYKRNPIINRFVLIFPNQSVKHMKNYFFITLVLACFLAAGQDNNLRKDSLSGKPYGYFHSRYNMEMLDRELLEAYLRAHLAKARREGNHAEMVAAYRSRLHASPRELQQAYADSMIWAGSGSGDQTVLGGAYLTKGMVLYSQKQYKRALDYYLMANTRIEGSGDHYLIHKVRYNIALIKYYMGDYGEAVGLLKECISYFEGEEEHAYLQSLHFLGLCYSGMGDFASSVRTNAFAMQEEFRLRNMELHHCFLHSEGVNHYFLGDYGRSIASLRKALPDLVSRGDFANESVAYFYMAKSFLEKEGIEEALPYFYKVDSIYGTYGYLRPDMRETYKILIGYFKDRGDVQRKMHYMDRLLSVDAMLHENYKYLAGRMYRQYNVRVLLKENRTARTALIERNGHLLLLGVFAAVLLLVIFVVWRKYRKTRRLYLQNFNLLMEQRSQPKEPESTGAIATRELEISAEIIAGVLKRLGRFEQTGRYLDKDLTLVRLSAYLNSNPNYVSKIIHHYKSKKYLEYITHLRIDHIIGVLEKEPRYRKYNYGALAAEAGFVTAKKFSRAFQDKTGIALHFFIEELEARARKEEK